MDRERAPCRRGSPASAPSRYSAQKFAIGNHNSPVSSSATVPWKTKGLDKRAGGQHEIPDLCGRGRRVPGHPNPLSAAPIHYVLSNVTATFPDGKDTITGNFTFDPMTDTIEQVDIIVIGPVFPGRYNRAPVATPLSVTASEEARRITTGVLGTSTA